MPHDVPQLKRTQHQCQSGTVHRPDKTVLSLSRPLRRCELDSRQLKTVAHRKLEVWTRSEQFTLDTTKTGPSCRVWCGAVNWVSPTSAFSVGVSGGAGTAGATAGRTPTQNALVGTTQLTPPDTTRRSCLCRVWRAVWIRLHMTDGFRDRIWQIVQLRSFTTPTAHAVSVLKRCHVCQCLSKSVPARQVTEKTPPRRWNETCQSSAYHLPTSTT